jgi:hypothetical protein
MQHRRGCKERGPIRTSGEEMDRKKADVFVFTDRKWSSEKDGIL